MKAIFKETPYTEFWVHQLNVPEYISIAEKVISVLSQITATYLRDSGFSCLCEIESRKRNSITHVNPLISADYSVNPLVQTIVQLSFCMLIQMWLFASFQVLSSGCMSSSQGFLGAP